MMNNKNVARPGFGQPVIRFEKKKAAEITRIGLEGDKLYRRIITLSNREIAGVKPLVNREDPACFVAGTMIHTRKGLVPIEQIKVGDWVLSQPEDKGGLSYKRVTQTFVHEGREVFLILFHSERDATREKQAQQLGLPLSRGAEYTPWIAVTRSHPFYVKDRGWVEAWHLWNGAEVELADGSFASATFITLIRQTPFANIGWAPSEPNEWSGGWTVDFRRKPILVVGGHKEQQKYYEGLEEPYWPGDYPAIRRTVYNFEVEDNHTYYVGAMGIWVHNKNMVTDP